MTYLLYGLDDYLIKRKTKEILKNNNIDDFSITYYDLENTLINTIIDDCETFSLFGDKKAIIVNNAYIFTGSPKKNIEQNIELLEKYIKNQIENTILIFISATDKLGERKKIVKLMKSECKVEMLNKTNNLTSIIKDMFNDYSISNQDINYLVDRIGNDLMLLETEINKIKTYKGNDKQICKEDINLLTHKNIDTDIFALIEAIINKDKDKAIEIYYEMLKMNEEPIKIIIMLANQFRIIYQTKTLYAKGHTENDITSILNIHPYRIKLALQKSRNFDEKKLLNYIVELANMDINIKNGSIDKNIALELFILKL